MDLSPLRISHLTGYKIEGCFIDKFIGSSYVKDLVIPKSHVVNVIKPFH